jgi:hypothetical protein
MGGGVFAGLHRGEQAVDRGEGEVLAGHADGGEGRDGVLGEMDVVEADQRKVIGDLEFGLEERVLDADGGHVVGAQDGGGPVGQSEDFLHRLQAAIEGVIGFDEPGRIDAKAGEAHAIEEGRPAGFCGAKAEGTADEGDFAVTEDGEVLHGFIDAGTIVDGEDAAAGLIGVDVNEHDGDLVGDEAIENELLDAEGHNGDAIYLALQHAAGAELHCFGLIVGGADEDLVSARDGDLLELLDQFGEEGIGDFGDDEAEQTALAGDEGAGLGVGEVIELGDGLPDASGQGRVHGRDVIDGA